MKHLLIFALAFLSILSACKKDSTTTNSSTAVVVKNLASLSASRVVFFRLKDSTIVDNADSLSTKWDIGFRTTEIIVNGGVNRIGQGGAVVYSGIFDDLKEIPATQVFNVDVSTTELAIPKGSDKGWYNFNMTNYVVTPLAGKFLLIQTADGKYAKLEILSYYKDSPASPTTASTQRYYTFRYVYQSDGSRKF